MNPGRNTQSISGAPPLDVLIGNAADVTITWRGARVDLTPYTRGNVARLTLE
jgi:cytoskeleton protein RodZ